MLFEKFGKVQNVRILAKNFRISGCNKETPLKAFVVFDTPKSAQAAVAEKILSLLTFAYKPVYKLANVNFILASVEW